MKGLYFYKLVSPYAEDETKDCKLTVNEIDHNFVTLKDADIKEVSIDKEHGFLVLETNSGDKLRADISSFTQGLEINYDKSNGTLEIKHDGVVETIDGLATSGNLSQEIVNNIITDETLSGTGTEKHPIGISDLEKTSSFRKVIRVLDKTNGESLPERHHLNKGDRFITFENVNEYGFLYSFKYAKQLVEDLNSKWRIPTKEDWDNMLNAIEPCESDRNHGIDTCNILLGKFAGKLLKSKTLWLGGKLEPNDSSECSLSADDIVEDDVTADSEDVTEHPKQKPSKTDGTDSYGMKLLASGYGDGCQMMDYFSQRGKFWTSTAIRVTDIYTKRFDYDKTGVAQLADNPNSLCSLRLVKDYDGKNFSGYETIEGVVYKTVLLPSLNSEHGYAIWLGSNLAVDNVKYNPVVPNNGNCKGTKRVCFINEWNGFGWEKKALTEGDSMTILFGPDGSRDEEFRFIKGKLVNVKRDIIGAVVHKYDGDITILNNEVSMLKDRADETDKRILGLNEAIQTESDKRENADALLESAINTEIADRKEAINAVEDEIADVTEKLEAADQKLDESISAEKATREEVEAQIWASINGEIKAREDVEKQIWEAINNETTAREDVESQLWKGITAEREARESVEAQLWDAVNGVINDKDEVNKQIWEAINNETAAREDVEKQIWSAINKESDSREDVEAQIWKSLNNEIARAKAAEEELDSQLVVEEGSSYKCREGILTLAAKDEEKTIHIKLDSNYGTF
jgi:hypothetical protein